MTILSCRGYGVLSISITFFEFISYKYFQSRSFSSLYLFIEILLEYKFSSNFFLGIIYIFFPPTKTKQRCCILKDVYISVLDFVSYVLLSSLYFCPPPPPPQAVFSTALKSLCLSECLSQCLCELNQPEKPAVRVSNLFCTAIVNGAVVCHSVLVCVYWYCAS